MKYIHNATEVDAFKIMNVTANSKDGTFHVGLDNGTSVLATKEMCARMAPQIGDYWVKQPDGYIYLNPKTVFERNYREAPGTKPAPGPPPPTPKVATGAQQQGSNPQPEVKK